MFLKLIAILSLNKIAHFVSNEAFLETGPEKLTFIFVFHQELCEMEVLQMDPTGGW